MLFGYEINQKLSHFGKKSSNSISHRIHVWYICLRLVDFYGFHVGKYTSTMDPSWVFPTKHSSSPSLAPSLPAALVPTPCGWS